MLEQDIRSGRPRIQDRVEFNEEVDRKKDELKAHKPKRLKGATASKAYTLVKKLDKYIGERMPSSDKYFLSYPKGKDKHSHHTDFEKAVQHQVAFQTDKKLQQAITARKHIMARLDPDDPSIRSIENLRR